MSLVYPCPTKESYYTHCVHFEGKDPLVVTIHWHGGTLTIPSEIRMLSRFPFQCVYSSTSCHHIMSCLFYPFCLAGKKKRKRRICPPRTALMWRSRCKCYGICYGDFCRNFLWIQMPFDFDVRLLCQCDSVWEEWEDGHINPERVFFSDVEL